MAATEEKKYLVNVESNLDKYAKDAKKAAEEVDRLTAENIKLKGSSTASKEEIEKSNSSLRTAQKEYRDAKKMVDLQTQANKSEAGSRKQLSEILTLQMRELGKLGNAYVKDAQGVMRLNPLYAEQRNRIEATKQSIIEYDKALGDGRSNVGRYEEAMKGALGQISALPGPLGKASGAVQSFVSNFSKISPLGAIITGVLAAVSAPLIAFFTKAEEGIELLQRKMSGLKASIGVLQGEFIKLGKSMIGERGDEASPWGSRIVKGLRLIATTANFIPAVRKYFDDLAERMNDAGAAAEEYTRKMQELEDLETDMIVPRAKANLQIKEAMLNYEDENKSIKERMSALKLALDIETKTLDDEVRLQQLKILTLRDTNNELEKTGQLRDEDKRKLQEAIAEEIRLSEESVGRKIKVTKRIATAEAELLKEEAAINLQAAKDAAIAEIERLRNLVNEKKDYEIKVAEETGADVMQIRKRYADAEVELAKLTSAQKLELTAGFASNIAAIFGENTVIGKAAAIAETTINTYAAATAAYKSLAGVPVVGPVLGIAAAGAAIAAGIANVKKIVAVKSGLPGDSGGGGSNISAPTAITSTPAAHNMFASQVPSTFLTQPQLSQTQLNAVPQNMLTAEDIANAISKLPAPVVSVEDINARSASKRRIEVRANI